MCVKISLCYKQHASIRLLIGQHFVPAGCDRTSHASSLLLFAATGFLDRRSMMHIAVISVVAMKAMHARMINPKV